MNRGRVYTWTPDRSSPSGGHLRLETVPLPRLVDGTRLRGDFVEVRNAGTFLVHDSRARRPLGDAEPDAAGDFLFDAGRGGGRIDKTESPTERFCERYVQASRFGEVNAYFHVDRVAAWADEILRSLGAAPLPKVVVIVNAHDATPGPADVDGVRGTRRWLPFQGGHYRVSRRPYGSPFEKRDVSPTGEIHLGPGWRALREGALAELTGRAYRANAAHNAGILYHEYGHHLTRHTADFEANALRKPARQRNHKSAIDEGTSDYVAATMLGTPHVWAWHRPPTHPRNLATDRGMAAYEWRGDPHSNGTLWGAALWSLRESLAASETDGARTADRLVVAALLLLGTLVGERPGVRRSTRKIRGHFVAGAAALLRADELLFRGRHRDVIARTFLARGIVADADVAGRLAAIAEFSSPSRTERAR